jgi:hypothetical protein
VRQGNGGEPMKTRLLFLACLFVLGVGRAEGAILFASGTIQRLNVQDYHLDLSYIVYPDPSEYPAGGPWEYVFPQGAFATIQGNFASTYEPTYGQPYLSTIIQPDPNESMLFLTLNATQDWLFEIELPGGYPGRTFAGFSAQGSFFAVLPQEIGTSSALTQTPEASSFALLALGLLPLAGLLTGKSKRLAN